MKTPIPVENFDNQEDSKISISTMHRIIKGVTFSDENSSPSWQDKIGELNALLPNPRYSSLKDQEKLNIALIRLIVSIIDDWWRPEIMPEGAKKLVKLLVDKGG